VRTYLLKEDFQQFWEYHSPTWAAKFLDDWCQQVMRSRIEPMKKAAKTLLGHRELILNYFRAKKQFSSGVIEGLNNKAKLTMRKAYDSERSPLSNLLCTTHWENYRSQTLPTDSTDEPRI
jgi:transposase